MKREKRKYIYEIGILLSLIGIPISSVINEYLQGKIKVTNILLFISLVLVAEWKRLFRLNLRLNTGVLLILFFQVYVVIIEVIAGQALIQTARGMIYTLFMIVILVFASSRRKLDDPDHFIKTTWYVLGIFNVALLYLITDGFTSFSIHGRTVLDYGADRLTLSKLGFAFLVSDLAFNKSRNKKNVIATVIFMGATLFDLIYCNRRATILYFLIIGFLHYTYYEKMILHLRSNKVQRKKIIKVVVPITTAIVICIIGIRLIPNLGESIIRYINSIGEAIGTFLGRTQTDVSASTRNVLRQQAFSWLSNSNIQQIVFGRGYMYEYLDFPILQAVIDMGLMGLFYIFVQLIYPLKFLVNRDTNAAERFFQYYALLYFFDNFFAGIPYGYGKFVPLLYLFLQVSPARKKKQ